MHILCVEHCTSLGDLATQQSGLWVNIQFSSEVAGSLSNIKAIMGLYKPALGIIFSITAIGAL